MSQINIENIESLQESIYNTLMKMEGMGMGEMGEAREEADRMVLDWIEEQEIEVLFKGVVIIPHSDYSLLNNMVIIEDNEDTEDFKGDNQTYIYRGYWFKFVHKLQSWYFEEGGCGEHRSNMHDIMEMIDNIYFSNEQKH